MNHDWHAENPRGRALDAAEDLLGLKISWTDEQRVEREWMAERFLVDARRIVFTFEEAGAGGGYLIMGASWVEEAERVMRENGLTGPDGRPRLIDEIDEDLRRLEAETETENETDGGH